MSIFYISMLATTCLVYKYNIISTYMENDRYIKFELMKIYFQHHCSLGPRTGPFLYVGDIYVRDTNIVDFDSAYQFMCNHYNSKAHSFHGLHWLDYDDYNNIDDFFINQMRDKNFRNGWYKYLSSKNEVSSLKETYQLIKIKGSCGVICLLLSDFVFKSIFVSL